VEESSEYDAAEQVRRVVWYLSTPDEPDFRVIDYRLRVIFPQELVLLLDGAGFRLETRYGEFTRETFTSSSPRQVCVCSPAQPAQPGPAGAFTADLRSARLYSVEERFSGWTSAMRRLTRHVLAVFVLSLASAGLLEAQQPASGSLPPGAKLFIAPMEWHLDQFLATEIHRQGVRVQVVADRRDADFVMTSLYTNLGSRMTSPGHYIQITIAAANDGKQVWQTEVNDFGLFFAQLRPHGPARAARAIVRKLRIHMSGAKPVTR
jgi:hypothetical protein